MSAANYDLVVDQGSTFAIDLTVKVAGVAKDLTGYAARAKIKSSKSTSVVSAEFTCTIPAPTSDGIVKMELLPAVTSALAPGQYFYDLEIHTADNITVKRLIEGTVNLTAGITVGAGA
jgi:hypothetical protein